MGLRSLTDKVLRRSHLLSGVAGGVARFLSKKNYRLIWLWQLLTAISWLASLSHNVVSSLFLVWIPLSSQLGGVAVLISYLGLDSMIS